MKHKRVNKAMACVLAMGMTFTGCGKNSEPAKEMTTGGVENTAGGVENTGDPVGVMPTKESEMAEATQATAPTTSSEENRFDVLKPIADQDLFEHVKVSHDRLLKCDIIEDEEMEPQSFRFSVMDKFGNVEFSYTPSVEGKLLYDTVTEDEGLLLVVGGDSGNGKAEAQIVKLGTDGSVQFETPLEVYGVKGLGSFDYCYEADGNYYLFGTMKRVNTGITDVYAFQIGSDGTSINRRKISGGDDTELILAEPDDDGFHLLVETCSSTGDFKEINFWAEEINASVNLDKDLNIQKITKEEPHEALLKESISLIGEKAGTPVFSNDPFLQAYELKDPTLFIDYGDHYLIRGKREIGRIYPKGSNYEEAWDIVYETVYAVYDMDGNIVFREAIDPSLEFEKPLSRCLPGRLPVRKHNSEAWYCDKFVLGEEAADALMSKGDESLSDSSSKSIDVTPEGFYERTGGRLFIASRSIGNAGFHPGLYYVNGTEKWCSTLGSVAVYDVNDDGKDEVLLLSYGPTYGFFTVTLTCITDHDSISLTLYGPGWNFNADENGRLRIGDGYIDILDLLGKKRLMVHEEVIYETIDGEKKEYLRAVLGETF